MPREHLVDEGPDLAALARRDEIPGLTDVALPGDAYDGFEVSLSVSEAVRTDGTAATDRTGPRTLGDDFGVGDRETTLRFAGTTYRNFWVTFSLVAAGGGERRLSASHSATG